MIFMINEENCENIIKQAYRPQFDGRLVSVLKFGQFTARMAS